MLFKLKCGVAFELLVRVAREHVNLNAFTVLLVSICVWVRWFSQEENKRKMAFRCLVWVSGSGGGGAGRVVWGYGYHVVVHRRPATA